MAKDAKYIYGVIQNGGRISFGPLGIGGRGDEVYILPYQDLAAVVSDCPSINYKAVKDKEKIVRDLAAHQRVTEEVMKHCSILPMKFGTMVAGEKEVESVLRQGYFNLKEAQAAFQDKVEVEVVVTWDLASVFSQIGNEEPIAKLKAKAEGKPGLKGLNDRIKLGKMVYESLSHRREDHQREIVKALANCSIDMQKNALMDDSFVMNAAFLIDKERQDEFDERLEELDKRMSGALNFRRIGPLPPYSFATIEVRPMTHGEVKRARESLGLGEKASLEEVKKAYYGLAQGCHPDAQPDSDVEERFTQIAQAYESLKSYCLGQAAAQGITSKKVAADYSCSFTPAAVEEGVLVTVKRLEREG